MHRNPLVLFTSLFLLTTLLLLATDPTTAQSPPGTDIYLVEIISGEACGG